MVYLAVLLLSLLCTIALLAPLRHFAARWHLIDAPGARKVHVEAIPRIGGMAMVPAWATAVAIWMPNSVFKLGLLCAVAILFIFCILDDRFDLHYGFKLIGQLAAATVAVVVGDLHIRVWPFFPGLVVPVEVSAAITIVAVVGVINALNLIDGLDGLAGGIALIACGLISILALGVGGAELIIVCVATIGSLLGFLRYNGHPAVIFMGDSGSQFLGLITAIAALYLSQVLDHSLSPLFPFAVLALPIADTVLVFMRRIYARVPPFRGDKRHIHHRLLGAGLTHLQAVIALYSVHLLIVCGLYVLAAASDWVLLGYLACIVSALAVLSAERLQPTYQNGLIRLKAVLVFRYLPDKADHWRSLIDRSVDSVVILTLVLFFGSTLFYGSLPSGDVAVLAVVLFALSLSRAFARKSKGATWFDKLLTYVTGTVVVFCTVPLGDVNPGIAKAQFYLVVVGFLYAVVLGAVSNQQYFRVTPTDILIIAAVAVLPLIEALNPSALPFGRYLSEIIMMYYLLEYLYQRDVIHQPVFSGAQSLVCLSLVAVLHF